MFHRRVDRVKGITHNIHIVTKLEFPDTCMSATANTTIDTASVE